MIPDPQLIIICCYMLTQEHPAIIFVTLKTLQKLLIPWCLLSALAKSLLINLQTSYVLINTVLGILILVMTFNSASKELQNYFVLKNVIVLFASLNPQVQNICPFLSR